ncbi:AAA family ATPase [Curvibacter sp. HBC28]|uniref:AAA family ATPase n=2 Tax=Curvibacter microcysteis TaxID=3026419 RepID=A0ABT5MFM8_9BURK|nr:AAA family ATPase [Curvibacter sp. HBC28]
MQPLSLKYRKGLGLLGFLASHADRVFRRETLAELLWPDISASAGRANLRVVLADLTAVFRQLGLDGLFEVQRDWLALRPGERLITDVAALAASAQGQAMPAPLEQRLREQLARGTLWLAEADQGTSADFQEWLHAQRQHLEDSLKQAVPDTAAAWAPRPLAGQVTSAHEDAGPHISLLTLLRVEPDLPEGEQGLSPAGPPSPWVEAVRALARLHGGEISELSDSGLTLVFGLNQLHTGQRWQALQCAYGLHELLAPPMKLRMGLSAGRTLVLRQPQLQLLGSRKRLVERLALSADSGEVVCDESLLDLAQHLGFQALGARRFRGFQEEHSLFRGLLAQRRPMLLPPGGDFSGGYFGREAWLDRARQGLGAPAPARWLGLCVQGDPGMGKTRLAWELARQQQNEGRPTFWLSALPEAADQPWRGLLDLFQRLLAGPGQVEAQLDRLAQQLGATLSPPAHAAIAGLIRHASVPQGQQGALAEGLGALLRGRGEHSALVVIDDVQWLDQPSTQLLNRLIQNDPSTQWVLTQRSQTQHGLRLAGLQEWVLPPLDDASAEAILNTLPDADLLSPEARRGRIANARGLPLYLLADSVAADPSSHFSEFCQALLNRLGDARAPMAAAAVFGMLFAIDDLATLCGTDVAAQACERALASGLLVARGTQQASFFHPRLREHLLSVTPAETLQQHARHAAALLQQRRQYTEAAVLWEQAQQSVEARQAWFLAAQTAWAEDDICAACHSSQRLAQLGYLDGAPGLRARILHAHALIARDGYGSLESQQVMDGVAEASIDLASLDPDTRFNGLMLSYLGAASRGHADGLAHAQALQDAAHSPAQHMTACWARGNTLFWMGRLREAREALTQCIHWGTGLSPRERMLFFPSDLSVFAQAELGWLLWFLGEHEASQTWLQQAQAQAERSSTRQDPCIANCFAALSAWCQDDLARTHTLALQAYQTAEAEGFGFWLAVAGLLLALAQGSHGQPVDVQPLMAAADTMLAGYRAGTTTALWLLGATLQASGRAAEALPVLEQALLACESYEHRYCRMDLHRLHAQALAQLGQTDHATQAWQQAWVAAQDIEAQGWLQRWGPQHPATGAARGH